MSSGGGVVGGVLAVGVVYWIALAIGEIAVFAAMALVVAIIVGAAIAVVTLWGWAICLGEAVRLRDWGWMRDLILAPAAAVFCVVFFANGVAIKFRDFEASQFVAEGNKTLSHGWPLLVVIFLGPICGILFLACLIGTPLLLAIQNGLRLLAYPAFIFFALYLSGLSIVIHNGWDSTEGARASLLQQQQHQTSAAATTKTLPRLGLAAG